MKFQQTNQTEIQKLQFQKTVILLRIVWIALCILMVYFNQQLNIILQQVWSHISQYQIVRSKLFEPFCAGVGFGLPIQIWRWVIKHYKSSISQYKIKDNIEIKQEKLWGFDHVFQSLIGYYLPMFILYYYIPEIKMIEDVPSFWSFSLQIFFGILVYDFLFFWLHLSMHKVQKLKKYHLKHHQNPNLVASDSLRHSFIDGSLQVLSNILVLNLIRAHPFHRIIHNLIISYLFTETHSGYNMPWMHHNIIPFNIFGGSIRHEIHHTQGQQYFQQFFTYLDYFLENSEQKLILYKKKYQQYFNQQQK